MNPLQPIHNNMQIVTPGSQERASSWAVQWKHQTVRVKSFKRQVMIHDVLWLQATSIKWAIVFTPEKVIQPLQLSQQEMPWCHLHNVFLWPWTTTTTLDFLFNFKLPARMLCRSPPVLQELRTKCEWCFVPPLVATAQWSATTTPNKMAAKTVLVKALPARSQASFAVKDSGPSMPAIRSSRGPRPWSASGMPW